MNNEISGCAGSGRQVASVVVMNKASDVMEQAEGLLNYMDSKLRTIAMPSTPQVATDGKIQREMPELFGELDSKLGRIRSALDSMRGILERVELE